MLRRPIESTYHEVGTSPATGSYFEAVVEGAVSARPSGGVAFGVVGDSSAGIASFTITLDAEGSSGAILLTGLDGKMPAPGRYELTGGAPVGASAFRASYIAGSAERPTGLFRATSGTLEITAAGSDHISGQFSFTGSGFTTSDASDGWPSAARSRPHVSFRPRGRPSPD
ncbi:hypothetical protein BH24GEM1_BH24GEM1_03400 [soil metagenome]